MRTLANWIVGFCLFSSIIIIALAFVYGGNVVSPDVVHPWHVLSALLTLMAGLGGMMGRLGHTFKTFRVSVIDELRVTRVSIKELLADLAVRNPEAMARIITAMNDQSVVEYVRSRPGGK